MPNVHALFGKSTSLLHEVVDNDLSLLQDSPVLPKENYGADANITKLTINILPVGEVDLRASFQKLEIYENIYASSLQGSIDLLDRNGGIERLRLKGGETISLNVSSPQNELFIARQDLVVHKILKHEVDVGTLNATYTLVFCSKSLVRSMRKNIFKSYKKQPVINVIKDLYKEMSPSDLVYEDPNFTLKTPFISTGLSPHKAIDFLSQRCCRRGKFFVFFERLIPIYGKSQKQSDVIFGSNTTKSFVGSHYFGSVDKLIDDARKNPIFDVYFEQKVEANIEPNKIRASKLLKSDNFNHIESTERGLHRTEFTFVNPLNREVNSDVIEYKDSNFFKDVVNDVEKNQLINNENIFNILFNSIKKTGASSGNRKVVTSGDDINDIRSRKDWLAFNIYGSLIRTLYSVAVEVQGGTNEISLGHIVNLVVPSADARAFDLDSIGSVRRDPTTSGKYVVTGVRHKIEINKYTKLLELGRGSSPVNYNARERSLSEL
tara:strand:- start:1325 stop:2797 length:1473 start_codon:yes stop_codon:yes gene_type:complete